MVCKPIWKFLLLFFVLNGSIQSVYAESQDKRLSSLDALLRANSNVALIRIVATHQQEVQASGMHYVNEANVVELLKGEDSKVMVGTQAVPLEVGWRYLLFWNNSSSGVVNVGPLQDNLIAFIEDISAFAGMGDKEYVEYREYFNVGELNDIKIQGSKLFKVGDEVVADQQFYMVEWSCLKDYLLKALNKE